MRRWREYTADDVGEAVGRLLANVFIAAGLAVGVWAQDGFWSGWMTFFVVLVFFRFARWIMNG